MDTKKEFIRLKECWKHAKGSEREAAEKKMDSFFDSLTELQKLEVQSAVDEDFSRMKKEISEINSILDTREKLAKILPYISISNISKDFLGKTSSWFYQRLNGNKVHGKPAAFTSDEKLKFSNALFALSEEIKTAALKIT